MAGSLEWNQEETLKFIDFVRVNPIIWDLKNIDHYNKIKRQDAWERISEQILVPVTEIKKKWDSVQASFRREKKKFSDLGTGRGRRIWTKPYLFSTKTAAIRLREWGVPGRRSVPQLLVRRNMEQEIAVTIVEPLPPRRSFPSEQRYSATTVGGLAAVHMAIAGVSLVFAFMAIHKLQVAGVAALLACAAFASGSAGLFAWKRWYVDSNIGWFFLLSCVSGVLSVLTMILTTTLLFTAQAEKTETQYISTLPRDGNLDNYTFDERENPDLVSVSSTEMADYNYSQVYGDIDHTTIMPVMVIIKSRNYDEDMPLLVALNIIFAAVLEVCLSAISGRVAWKGLKNNCEDIKIQFGALRKSLKKKPSISL